MISVYMGRYYDSKKVEADALKKIQIWWLKKNNYLEGGWQKNGGIRWSSNWSDQDSTISFAVELLDNDQHIRLSYAQTNEEGVTTNFDYKIMLTTTPCYFGGKRYWFICPFYINGIYCGRRVGVLYLVNKYFACRHCNNLSYSSRNLSGIGKVIGQVISAPELDELREGVKFKYYKGKQTRKYKRYLVLAEKSFLQLKTIVSGLSKTKRLS